MYQVHRHVGRQNFDFMGVYPNGELNDSKEMQVRSPLGYDSDLCTMKRLQKALVRALMGLGFTITYIDPGVFYAYVDEHRLISDPCGAC